MWADMSDKCKRFIKSVFSLMRIEIKSLERMNRREKRSTKMWCETKLIKQWMRGWQEGKRTELELEWGPE
jgi:hypothetical protein